MARVAAMPIYGKNHSKINLLLWNQRAGPIALKLGIQHRGLGPIIICSNDDPGLTLTSFMPKSDLVTYAIVWENVKWLSTGPIEAELYMEPPRDGGTKVF